MYLSPDASELLVFMETSMPSVEKHSQQSVFNLRTDDSSAKQYFQFYGYLSQQQNMLQVKGEGKGEGEGRGGSYYVSLLGLC